MYRTENNTETTAQLMHRPPDLSHNNITLYFGLSQGLEHECAYSETVRPLQSRNSNAWTRTNSLGK